MKKYRSILIILIVSALGYLTYGLLTQKKSSPSDKGLSEFAVKDTSLITRIIISSNAGGKVDFNKQDGKWFFNEGGCVQQHMIKSFLETIKYIAIKGPVQKGAIQNVNKRILGRHKKIEIFQNNKLFKTWYIGTSTRDHYGTYMLLKTAAEGTSPEPYIMYLPNMYGNLSDQFSLRKKDYECSEIFVYDPLNIKTVEVELPDSSHLNFRIESIGENAFELYQNDTKIEGFDTTRVRAYLVGFRKIHYDTKEPIMPDVIRDSILDQNPNYIITITDNNGDKNRVETFLKPAIQEKYDYNGDLIKHDRNHLFALSNEGTFLLIQYHVFDKLFRDINYFKKR